jgi:poly [ADP-ribose] polymerase
MANVIEEAKSGRASCRTCKKAIGKGELRLGVETQTQFSDTPSMQWHHVLCAATKLPAELKEALAAYEGDVPNRAELDQAMEDAIKKGGAKPGGFPYVDRAPTGRAKCMQCDEAIAKDSFRVAVERQLDTGSFAGRGTAGYLHPKCVAENLENVGGSVEEMIEGLRKNSRIPPEDLDAVIAEIGGGGGGGGGEA